jgi:hypothetical protein
MVADSRLAEPEWLGQVADARFVAGLGLDQAQQPQPRRVGDHPQRGCELKRILGVKRLLQQRRAGVSILASLALTVILVSWLAHGVWNNPFTYFAFMATTATFGILGTYILVALAGMTYFWRTRVTSDVAYNLVLDVVLPVGAIVVCGLTIYWSITPRPPAPISYSIWVALGWLGLGVAYLLWLRATAPEKVSQFGSVLAEGGEAVAPTLEAEPASSG